MWDFRGISRQRRKLQQRVERKTQLGYPKIGQLRRKFFMAPSIQSRCFFIIAASSCQHFLTLAIEFHALEMTV